MFGIKNFFGLSSANETFKLLTNDKVAKGIKFLTKDLTINGTTVSPTFRYEAKDVNPNIAVYSQEFDNAAWTKLRASITANSTTAPDGTTTADTLVEDGTAANSHYIYGTNNFPISAGTKYVLSVYAKAINRNWLGLFFGSGMGFTVTYFNLSTGTVGTVGTIDGYGIEDMGNGWYRCWIMDTAPATSAATYGILASAVDGNYIFDGLSQDSLYIWGAQVEEGSSPSVYKATTSTTYDWTAVTGEKLAGTGTGGYIGLSAPYSIDDKAVNGNTTRYWQASNNSFADITTEDFVFECVIKADVTINEYIFSKRVSTGTFEGYGAAIYGSNIIAFFLDDVDGGVVQVQYLLPRGAWCHVMFFADRSGSGVVYLNGIQGTPVSISTVDSMSNTDKLTLSATGIGGNKSKTDIAYLSMWKQSSWLDNHLQADLATERYNALLNTVLVNGPSVLERNLTINNQTVAPTFIYEARNALTSSWTTTVGEELTGVGSGWTTELDTPFVNTTDKAVNGNGTGYWEASNSGFADISTEDFVVEAVFKAPADTSSIGILGKADSNSGFLIYTFSNQLRCQLRVNPQFPSSNVTIVPNVWYHAIFFADRSGSSSVYLNGTTVSSAVISSATDLSNTNSLKIASGGALSGIYSDNISYIAMWKKDSWLDTNLQADLAKERFYKLCGVYPELAKGTAIPTYTRASTAYLDKFANATGSLFQVGNGWARVCSRTDVSGSQMTGYLSELSSGNLFSFSQDFDNASWFKSNTSISASAGTVPDYSSNASIIVEDATAASTHYLSESFTQTASKRYSYSVFAKAINRNWIQLFTTSATDGDAYAYFDLSAGSVGTTSGVSFSGIEDWGDGWYRCWMSDSRTTAEVADVRIYLASADTTNSFDGLSQDGVYIWGAQLETYGTYYSPSSIIYTSGSSAARQGDLLYYTADDGNVINNQQGAFSCDVLIPARPPTANNNYIASIADFSSYTADRISAITATSDQISFVTAATGGNGGNTSGEIISTNQIKSYRLTWKKDEAKLYLNDTQAGTTDDSVDIPDDLDRIYIGTYTLTGYQLGALLSNVRIFQKPTKKK